MTHLVKGALVPLTLNATNVSSLANRISHLILVSILVQTDTMIMARFVHLVTLLAPLVRKAI